jgi:hypothetical protein
MQMTRPPMGLRPRFIVVGERIEEIKQAIARYKEAGLDVPEHWTQELDDLTRVVVQVSPGHTIVNGVPTYDLDTLAWESIKKAADMSSWIPPDYYMNHWVYDVCEYLQNGK